MQFKSESVDPTGNEIESAPPRISEIRRVLRVMFSRWVVVAGTVIVLALIVAAIFAPLISPYDPYKQDLTKTLKLPSREHLLGTDALGRDILSRIIYGSQPSLMVGIIAVAISTVIGSILGLAAGYISGLTNTIIMRFIDALMAIPPLILSFAMAAAMGGGLRNVMIAIGVSMVPTAARLMCGQVLSIKQSDYVAAAQVSGASALRIMLRHLLPNAFAPMLVLTTMNMAIAILAEAGLSFLGIGISPPAAAWGGMVSQGFKYLTTFPLLSFAPGVAILLVALSFNMVGDGLRDALDPRLRGTI